MKFTFRKTLLLIEEHKFCELEDVRDWMRVIACKHQLTIIEESIGADRAQWIISKGEARGILFFEVLSESLWLEALHGEDASVLAQFCNGLSCNKTCQK